MESPTVVVRQAARTLVEDAVGGGEGLLSSNLYLRNALVASGRGELEAAELAEAWQDRHQEAVETELEGWLAIGLPLPAIAGSRPGRYLTFLHERYREETTTGLPPDYSSWLEAVETAEPRRFLLIVTACLHAVGCRPTLIVDGAGDHGVDCVGLINDIPGRGLVILGQAKTSSGPISQTTVRNDVREFQETFWDSTIGGQVIRALSLSSRRDGHAAVYSFFGGDRFSESSTEYASRARVWLRDSRQIAWHLSRSYDRGSLSAFLDAHQEEARRDLTKDWAAIINAET